MENTELTALINGCLKHELTAQKRLYDKFNHFVLAIIKRYTDDTAVSKELLNDVFFIVLTKLHQYSFKGSFEGWIRQITVNAVGMHFRKNIRKISVIKPVAETNDFIIDSEAVEKISHKELLQYVYELPETQRIVFNLFVFEDYSHKKIGSILNIKEDNSRWYLADARNRLKEKIRKFM